MDTPYLTFSTSKPITSIAVRVDALKADTALKAASSKEKLAISLGDIILWAAAKSLEKHPTFNSNFSTQMHTFSGINTGYLLNFGDGVKTIVITDANTKTVAQTVEEVKRNAMDYLRGEFKTHEAAPTFVISNLSAFGGYAIFPPLYEELSCVLAVGSFFPTADENPNGKSFLLCLSFDSRIADCQKALEFLNHLKSLIENHTS